MALDIMQENFAGIATVDVDKELKIYSITPTDSGFITDLNNVINGDPDAIDSWDTMVANMQDLSTNVSEIAPGYSIALVNPVNTENVLLLFIDGYEFYNFANE